jgi:L-ribulose-5-phosphate 3-epimerase
VTVSGCLGGVDDERARASQESFALVGRISLKPEVPVDSSCAVTLGVYEKALPEAMTWPERLAAAGRAGFVFVEISIDESEQRLARLDWSAEQRAALREAAASSGVRLTSMCLSAHRKYPMGSQSAVIRQRGLDLMKQAVAFAQDVGIRIVLVPGYDVFYEPGTPQTQARFLDGLCQAVAWASSAGVMLAIENTDRSVTSIRHALWYVRKVNSPWLQLYGDVGNLVAMDFDVLAELEAGAGHLVGIHLKDAVHGRFRGVPFGTGQVPFRDVFHKLWQIGFQGPILLEMLADHEADAVQAIADARDWVQAHLAESLLSRPDEGPDDYPNSAQAIAIAP